jgi:glycosyltransferase involved in cell wall biosynthesis
MEYTRRIEGRFDLIIDSRHRQIYRYGNLTIHLTGEPRPQYIFAARAMAGRIAREYMPDLITSQDPFGTALAGWSIRHDVGRPLLIQNHSSFLFNQAWLAERPVYFHALHWLAQWILPRADGWRVVNGSEKQIYVDRLGLPEDRIRILPVPCDLTPFRESARNDPSQAVRKKWRVPVEANLIIWAGRPVRVKRLPKLMETFAKVMAEIPNTYLILAGDKELAQENVDAIAENMGISDRCRWTGVVSRRELAALFAASDLFLMTSAYEGFGRVLVEAGAAGLPVVSTATAGALEIVRDGETGLLAPVDDVDALASRVMELCGDRPRLTRMGRTAREAIPARFESSKAFEGVVKQWRDLAAARRHP